MRFLVVLLVLSFVGTAVAQPPRRGKGPKPEMKKMDPQKMLEFRIKMLEKQLAILKKHQKEGTLPEFKGRGMGPWWPQGMHRGQGKGMYRGQGRRSGPKKDGRGPHGRGHKRDR